MFTLAHPAEIVSKSMPKRLPNRLRLRYPLGTPKNTIFDVKTSPDGSPKFLFFFENRLKILAMTVFGPRCLLKASKSLPRASQEPPKSRPRARKRPSRAFKSLPLGPQEDSKSLLCRPFYLLSQNSKQGSRGAARPRAAQESKLSRVF